MMCHPVDALKPTARPLMQRLDVLAPLRARRPLEVAQAEVRDPVGAAHALLPLIFLIGLFFAAVLVAFLADAGGHAAGVLDALLVRPADPVEARVCKDGGREIKEAFRDRCDVFGRHMCECLRALLFNDILYEECRRITKSLGLILRIYCR